MRSRRGISVIAVIVLMLPVQLALHRFAGSEPYPALFMPSFGQVPVVGQRVVVTRLTVVASSSTKSVHVDPVELVPNETRLAESIARFFFEDEDAVREVAANGWLRGRLRNIGVEADNVEVTRERLFLDQDSHEVVQVVRVATYAVALDRGPA